MNEKGVDYGQAYYSVAGKFVLAQQSKQFDW
jgi:hypothetical protein